MKNYLTIVTLLLVTNLAFAFELGEIKVLSNKQQRFYAIIPIKELQLDGFSTIGGNIAGYHRYIDEIKYAVERKGDDVFLVLNSASAVSEPFNLKVSITYRDQLVTKEYRVFPKEDETKSGEINYSPIKKPSSPVRVMYYKQDMDGYADGELMIQGVDLESGLSLTIHTPQNDQLDYKITHVDDNLLGIKINASGFYKSGTAIFVDINNGQLYRRTYLVRGGKKPKESVNLAKNVEKQKESPVITITDRNEAKRIKDEMPVNNKMNNDVHSLLSLIQIIESELYLQTQSIHSDAPKDNHIAQTLAESVYLGDIDSNDPEINEGVVEFKQDKSDGTLSRYAESEDYLTESNLENIINTVPDYIITSNPDQIKLKIDQKENLSRWINQQTPKKVAIRGSGDNKNQHSNVVDEDINHSVANYLKRNGVDSVKLVSNDEAANELSENWVPFGQTQIWILKAKSLSQSIISEELSASF